MDQTDPAAEEHAWVRQVADGDAAAYRRIVDRHLRPIHAFSRRMLGNEAAAEDVAQETFLRLWQQAHRYQPRARLSTYLHRIAHNLCIDHIRRRRQHDDDATDGLPTADRPSGLLHDKQTVQAVQAALEALPERQRAAITLTHYQGLSQREAAEVLGISEEALESLLSRARRALKQALSQWMKETG